MKGDFLSQVYCRGTKQERPYIRFLNYLLVSQQEKTPVKGFLVSTARHTCGSKLY